MRTVKVLKNIKNVTKFHSKFNEKSIQKTCSKKESQNMKTHQKSDPKMEPKSIKNHSKNRSEKKDEKKGANPGSGGMRACPKPNHFKRILRKKTHEESRLKGEYKVECKKWSAKGKCRKASADREPTTDPNTLGGQRPRADIPMGYRLFRRPQILFLCVIVFVCLGLCDCGVVSLWVCGLVFCGFVLLSSHVCVCLGAV